jgi:fluoride exporter
MLIFGLIVAGMIGAPARYVVERGVSGRRASEWPLGTLIVNVSGSLFLGVLTGLVLYHAFPATPRTILGTGFCGAYTTFSAFAYETFRLGEDGDPRGAMAYVAASLVLPTLAAGLGLALASL